MQLTLTLRLGMCLLLSLLSASPALAMERVASPNTINLLENLDAESAAVQGQWSLANGALRVEAQNSARLMFSPDKWPQDKFPQQKLPAAYDLRVAFTRITGQHSIAIIIPTSKGQCSLDLDAWGQHLAGFQLLNNQRLNQREPRVALQLQNNTRYDIDIQVRPDQLAVFINGKPLTTLPLNEDTHLTMLDLWRLPQADALGIGAYNAAAIFHEVTLTPIDLKDAAKDNAPAAPSQPAAPAVDKPVTTPATPPVTPPAANTPAAEQPVKPAVKPVANPAVDPLAALSDNFDNPATLNQWLRIFQVENAGANQVARVDINTTRKGWLTVIPHASSWFKDYRGILFFKLVTGNVVVTMHVAASNRQGNGPPRSLYSLAGIMIRSPRTETPITPQTWRPGHENYIFLSAGSARQPGTYQYEVKTTINSDSRLAVSAAPSGIVTFRAVRLGASIVLLRKAPGQGWIVHQRYRRDDFPDTLQIGLTTYTDWNSVQRLTPRDHNTRVIQGGNPDLLAQVDYIHYKTPPALPAALANADLSDANTISDVQLIEWLRALDGD